MEDTKERHSDAPIKILVVAARMPASSCLRTGQRTIRKVKNGC